MDIDPYVYPGTDVLINKLNIRDSDKLQEAETALYLIKHKVLPPGNFDYDHLKAIHKHFFGELYAWAGQERTVDIIKGNSHFARSAFISSEINKQFKQLKADKFLQQLDKATFSEKAAHYFNEINAAHPFREGNGRTLRAFFNGLAEQAGFQLDWTKVSTQEYIQASIEGFNGYDQSMGEVFRKVTLSIGRELNLSTYYKELSDYVNKQLQLNELVQLKNSHLARDPQAAKAYAEQALALDQELNSIAKRALQQADFQRDIASNYQERVPSIAEYGGFQGLKMKLEQEQLAKQDVASLL